MEEVWNFEGNKAGDRIRLECGLFGSLCREGGQEGLRSPVLGFRLER